MSDEQPPESGLGRVLPPGLLRDALMAYIDGDPLLPEPPPGRHTDCIRAPTHEDLLQWMRRHHTNANNHKGPTMKIVYMPQPNAVAVRNALARLGAYEAVCSISMAIGGADVHAKVRVPRDWLGQVRDSQLAKTPRTGEGRFYRELIRSYLGDAYLDSIEAEEVN